MPAWPVFAPEGADGPFCVPTPYRIGAVAEPTKLTAGTTWSWDREVPGHSASAGWQLRYALRGPHDLDIEATESGDRYAVSVSATTTADVLPGSYRLAGLIEREGDRHIVYDGHLVVEPNPLATVNTKTHAARALEVVEAAIEGRLTADQESFQIGGKSVTRIPMRDLLRLRGTYAAQVYRERNPGRLGPPVEVMFTPPGGGR